MRNAAIAQEGAPRDLYERPSNVFVADFIGDANLVDAEVRRVEGETATVSIGTIEIELPARDMAPGPAKVAIRPESVRLSDPGNGLAGQILKAAYLGDHLEYTVTTPVGELFVIDHSVVAPRPVGSSVSVSFGDRVALVPGDD